MKKIAGWVALAISAFIIFLLIKLPAIQVIARLSLPSDISLQGVSGTIWHGQAHRANVQGLPLQTIRWDLDFWPLLLGNISANIQAGNIRDVDDISFSGKLSVSNESLALYAAQAYLPTDLMMTMLPLPFPVRAEGRFKVEINALEYTQACQVLNGKGQWLNAEVAGLNQMINLGSFSANMACVNNVVVLEVKEPNRFGLSATASIPANLQFSITGRFKPDADLPEEIHQAAQFFGKADAQGYYPIKF